MSKLYSTPLAVEIGDVDSLVFVLDDDLNCDFEIVSFSLSFSGFNDTYRPVIVQTGSCTLVGGDSFTVNSSNVYPRVPSEEFSTTLDARGAFDYSTSVFTPPLDVVHTSERVNPRKVYAYELPSPNTFRRISNSSWGLSLCSPSGPLMVRGSVSYRRA